MKELIRLIALVEDIESTLFHYNHSIDGWHLSGETEPIMNFVADFDMEALTEAKQTLQALTSVKSESAEEKKEFNADFLYDEIFNILNANRGNFTETNSILKSRIILKYAKDIHNAVMSYKLNANADKKQHAISFIKYIDIWHSNRKDISYDDLYEKYIKDHNEYLTTLNNK